MMITTSTTNIIDDVEPCDTNNTVRQQQQRRRRKNIQVTTTLVVATTIIMTTAASVVFLVTSTSQLYNIQERAHNFLKGQSTRTTTISKVTSSSSSAAEELATIFDQVLIKQNDKSSSSKKKKKSSSSTKSSTNKSKQQHYQHDDIHVGRLLEACEKLAETNRNMGFQQSANDLMGNILKVRNVYDTFPSNNSDNHKESIRNLIEYEIQIGTHKDPTKNFDEHSASMGLLWLGRNINYQYDLFTHLIGPRGMEPYEAAKLAYVQDLKPHLNWTLQQVGQAALLALKPMKKSTILSKIAGMDIQSVDDDIDEDLYLETTQQDLKQILDIWEPLLHKYKQIFHDLDLGQTI